MKSISIGLLQRNGVSLSNIARFARYALWSSLVMGTEISGDRILAELAVYFGPYKVVLV